MREPVLQGGGGVNNRGNKERNVYITGDRSHMTTPAGMTMAVAASRTTTRV